MQIAVVDDCSPNGEAERIVERVRRAGSGSTAIRRTLAWARTGTDASPMPEDTGSISCTRTTWCTPDSMIEWALLLGSGRTSGRHSVNTFTSTSMASGSTLGDRATQGGRPGRLAREDLAEQHIQCASIVVRRDVYEQLGGYRLDLVMALDWEMWVRIAANYPVWFEPELLACWRVHYKNESSRLQREGSDVADILKAVEVIRRYLPTESVGEAASFGLSRLFHKRKPLNSCKRGTKGRVGHV